MEQNRLPFVQRMGVIRRILNRTSWTVRGYEFARSYRDTGVSRAQASRAPASLPASRDLEAYFDAHQEGPGIWKWRHYFDIYQRYLGKFVDRPIHLAEVGIYSGGSLGMWSHYFGEDCHVYGVDIEAACRVYQRDRVEIFIGDQADRQFWKSFKEKVPVLDVLIDDGGHLPEQMIVTLEEMLPHLCPGGVLIIEDIHGRNHRFDSYIAGLSKELNAMDKSHNRQKSIPASPFQQHIKAVHRYPYMTVIEKYDEPLADLSAPMRGTLWQPFLGSDHFPASSG